MDNALTMSNHDVAVLILAPGKRTRHKHPKPPTAAALTPPPVPASPPAYGRIPRKSAHPAAPIIEESQLTPDHPELNQINSSMYCFTAAILWPALAHVKPHNKHREIYLTDAISILNSNGETVLAEIAPDPRETLGCNTRADLAGVDRTFRESNRDQLMRHGVPLQLP